MISRKLPALVSASLVLLASPPCWAATAGQVPADRQETALAYAQCVRDKGYAEFPDPDPDGGFKFLIDPENVARFKAAADACRDIAPEGMRNDALTPAQLDALLRLAQCMRQNGVPDFPDPDSTGDFELGGLGARPGDPRFEATIADCRALAGDAPIMIGG